MDESDRCRWHRPAPGTDTVGAARGMPSMFPENRCVLKEGHADDHVFPTFAVIGHYTPTDAEIAQEWPGQEGKLDGDVRCELFESAADAEQASEWYPDGVVVEVTPAQ